MLAKLPCAEAGDVDRRLAPNATCSKRAARGVFAIGDARAKSVKWVAAAVCEGVRSWAGTAPFNQRTKKCCGDRRSGMQADHEEILSGTTYPILSINEVFRCY
jgi:hypothetical protein